MGVFRDGELHITALNDVLQLRPSFASLQPKGEEVHDAYSDDEVDEDAGSAPLQQVHMRRKESERSESSRMQSFSYVQSQEDAEDWRPLKVHPPGKDAIQCFH